MAVTVAVSRLVHPFQSRTVTVRSVVMELSFGMELLEKLMDFICGLTSTLTLKEEELESGVLLDEKYTVGTKVVLVYAVPIWKAYL